MKPHKHSKLIKAWADGAEIEFKDAVDEVWSGAFSPNWDTSLKYRVKPKVVKPTFYFKWEKRYSGFIETTKYTTDAYAKDCDYSGLGFRKIESSKREW